MKRLIVVSGAGLSVESGIRAFRTDTDIGISLWDQYRITDVCYLENFNAGFRALLGDEKIRGENLDGRNYYEITHDFYNKRRVELGTVEPNLGHLRIAEWHSRFPGKVANVTTNVDDLLERSGIPRGDIIHLHGYLKEIKYKHEASEEPIVVDIGFNELNFKDYYWAKPNVTLFGETAPWYMGQVNIFDTLTANDLIILVGTSNQVINFNWEIFPALNFGARLIVINPIINYEEQKGYEDRGVKVFREGAVSAFSNPELIKLVEDHLDE